VPWEEPGSTAIVVLTPEAEPPAGAFYRGHSNAGRDGMTLHVTLLVPFVPADGIDEDLSYRLDRLVGRFEAFEYGLARFEYFESGVLYLAPEPSRPFVDLVLALVEEFPDYPPYKGIHEDIVPHATIADTDDTELMGRIREEIEPSLPIECRAEAATLVERGRDLRWRPRAHFHLAR
jgi:2'-5' RNA ligase